MWCIQRFKGSIINASPLQHLSYSTHFMVDYLVDSIGFSKDQASLVLTHLKHLKSTQNPDSVLHFLNQCGLDKTQVRNIVSYHPRILSTSVDKTLEPKFKAVQQLALPAPSLEKLFKHSSNFSSNRLDANVNYLKGLLGSHDDKVSKVVQRSWWMLSSNFAHKLSATMLVLKKSGFSNDKIQTILVKNPGCLLQSPEWLEAAVNKVEPLLGVSPQSPRFLDGLEIIISLSKSKLDRKFETFRRFGWSDSEILTMTKALPLCLRSSEDRLEVLLKFFMSEVGYTAAYLATHPKLLVYSLEKRVKPRYQVLKGLKEKEVLKNKYSLCSVAALSEEMFEKRIVLPHQELVPHLFEAYRKATADH